MSATPDLLTVKSYISSAHARTGSLVISSHKTPRSSRFHSRNEALMNNLTQVAPTSPKNEDRILTQTGLTIGEVAGTKKKFFGID